MTRERGKSIESAAPLLLPAPASGVAPGRRVPSWFTSTSGCSQAAARPRDARKPSEPAAFHRDYSVYGANTSRCSGRSER
jgi:hypothetical protein